MYFKKIKSPKKEDPNPFLIHFAIKCLQYCPNEFHVELRVDYSAIWDGYEGQ